MSDGCWSDSEAEIVVTNVEFEMLADTNTNLVLSMQPALVDLPAKERGRNNFPNYASQLQAIFARYKSIKILK